MQNRFSIIKALLGPFASVVPGPSNLSDITAKHKTRQNFHQAILEWTCEGSYNAGLATGILILLILQPYSGVVLDWFFVSTGKKRREKITTLDAT